MTPAQAEQVDLAARAKAGDRLALGALIALNDGYCRMSARRVARAFDLLADLDDLTQEARLGIVAAVDAFDASRGSTFISCAAYWIRQAVYRAATAEYSRSIVKPSKWITANNDHRRRLRDDPNADAHTLAVSRMARAASLDAPVSTTDRGGDTLGDRLASDRPLPDAGLIELAEARERRQQREAVIEATGPRYRAAVAARLDGQTFQAIGDGIGVSRERVRQVFERAAQVARKTSRCR